MREKEKRERVARGEEREREGRVLKPHWFYRHRGGLDNSSKYDLNRNIWPISANIQITGAAILFLDKDKMCKMLSSAVKMQRCTGLQMLFSSDRQRPRQRGREIERETESETGREKARQRGTLPGRRPSGG